LVDALPTELQRLATLAGFEPATLEIQIIRRKTFHSLVWGE